MGRVELRHYPASKLPAELRGDFSPSDLVDVVVRASETRPPVSREALRATLYRNVKPGTDVGPEEAVRRIRELRDEWDD